VSSAIDVELSSTHLSGGSTCKVLCLSSVLSLSLPFELLSSVTDDITSVGEDKLLSIVSKTEEDGLGGHINTV